MKTIRGLSYSLLAFALVACEESTDLSRKYGPWNYSQNPARYVANRPIDLNKPSAKGNTFTISPELPDGLVMDPATGRITGTPTRLASPTRHSVTVSGAPGTSTTSLVIEVFDGEAPVITDFAVEDSSVASVPFRMGATDDFGLAAYCLAESESPSGCQWIALPPEREISKAGIHPVEAPQGRALAKELRLFVRDGAGNVSTSRSALSTVTVPDTTPPVITAFSMPAVSASASVPFTQFIATDNVAVTGYCVSDVNDAASCAWVPNPPTSQAFPGFSEGMSAGRTLFAFARDAAGNISEVKSASVTIAIPDITPPVITDFAAPATSASATVPITAFTATDNIAVTGYCVSAANAASSCSWTASAPTSFTFSGLSQGVAAPRTLHAFARDAAGNVSLVRTVGMTISLPDTQAPVITAFTIAATSAALSVPITAFTATDNVGVTGYCVTATASAADCSWQPAAPTSHAFSGIGEGSSASRTLHAFARDAAGNVSAVRSASVNISIPDITAPVVTAFTLPAAAVSATVPISVFTATDNVAVTGYCVNTVKNSGTCSWTASAPTSFTFTGLNEGDTATRALHAFARDAAGNISLAQTAMVAISLPDTQPPTVTAFSLPATASALAVPITVFTATDNVAVTGFCVSETASAAGCAWASAAPASHAFSGIADGSSATRALHAFARDAAGNVSVVRSASVEITIADVTVPTITAFAIAPTSASATVPITAFTASDNVAVTGYCVRESNTSTGCSWSVTPPASITFTGLPAGGGSAAKTAYAFARDAAGNISVSRSASTTLALPDTAAPTVTAFALPATSASATVPLTFTASDNIAVTGYCVRETNSSAGCAWSATPPASHVFSGLAMSVPANRSLYGFARDAAGNISPSRTASTVITLPDTQAPVVTGFAMPDFVTTATAPVSVFTATDNVGVTGYCLRETNSSSGCTWSATAPTSFAFSGISAGVPVSRTVHAFARDAAGNVSLAATDRVDILVCSSTAVPPGAVNITLPSPGPYSQTVCLSAASWSGFNPDLYASVTNAPVDVIFVIDVTGSMGGAIATLNSSLPAIITNLSALTNDVRYGVATFKDFPFDGGGSGDFPYRLDRSLTSDAVSIRSYLSTLTVSGGGDAPETLNTALWQVMTNAGIPYTGQAPASPAPGWRPAALKFIIPVTDAAAKLPAFDVTQAAVLSRIASDGYTVIGLGSGSSGTAAVTTYATRTNTAIDMSTDASCTSTDRANIGNGGIVLANGKLVFPYTISSGCLSKLISKTITTIYKTSITTAALGSGSTFLLSTAPNSLANVEIGATPCFTFNFGIPSGWMNPSACPARYPLNVRIQTPTGFIFNSRDFSIEIR